MESTERKGERLREGMAGRGEWLCKMYTRVVWFGAGRRQGRKGKFMTGQIV